MGLAKISQSQNSKPQGSISADQEDEWFLLGEFPLKVPDIVPIEDDKSGKTDEKQMIDEFQKYMYINVHYTSHDFEGVQMPRGAEFQSSTVSTVRPILAMG